MFKNILFSLLMASSFVANADIVHSNWVSDGDKKANLDTTTGLEWLKLSNTRGLSYNEFTANPDLFPGWRLPTSDEVSHYVRETFFASGAINDNYFDTHEMEDGFIYISKGNYKGRADSLVPDYLGQTFISSSYNISYGLYYDEASDQILRSGAQSGRDSFEALYLYDGNPNASFSKDGTNSALGFFLVSDGGATFSSNNDPYFKEIQAKDVPTPLAFSLLAFVSMLLFGRKNKLR